MNRTEMKANWIKTMAGAFRAKENKIPATVGAVVVGNRVAVMNIENPDYPAIGVAVCSPTDVFDLDTGLAIAWARMTGERIPPYVLNDDAPLVVCVSNLAPGQRFRYAPRNAFFGFRLDTRTFHMCGKNKDGSYKVYDEDTGIFADFDTVENDGEPVELIED